MKDARWQVALKLCEDLGIDWDSLPYAEQSRLLYSAQQYLNLASKDAVQKKADEFNEPPVKEEDA
jgi:hypothetical protein